MIKSKDIICIYTRKCRNWQTSKTKDLVAIAVVWVQVPSSALKQRVKPKGLALLFYDGEFLEFRFKIRS